MAIQMNRREFLKFSSYFMLSLGLPKLLASPTRRTQPSSTENILIILFDTFSAQNIPFHGYSRHTTPHLASVAERAIVYHNHFAAGSWTYPATASFLTGTYPWTNKALKRIDRIIYPYIDNNLFSLFQDYYRIAYTHNPLAERVLNQMQKALDRYQPRQSLFLQDQFFLFNLFNDDIEIASLGLDRALNKQEYGYASSLIFPPLYHQYNRDVLKDYEDRFPLDPPSIEPENYFLLEDAMNWIYTQSQTLPQPYLAYFHLLPPHAPYTTRVDFYNQFKDDGFHPPEKPTHFLNNGFGEKKLAQERRAYDEYILYVDDEIGRLIQSLEGSGVLENTWVIITSDHGELFERGIRGHGSPTYHQGLMNIPLMILEPGRTTRTDIFQPTSAIDLLPTLLSITSQPIPELLEGQILPPFSSPHTSARRRIYSADAKNPQIVFDQPLSVSSSMLLEYPFKLSFYQGFDQLPVGETAYELYDLENDPQELNNIYSPSMSTASRMAEHLLHLVNENNHREGS